jgi:predicted TIM-barrel fold metal-dependent hydrolase
MLTDDVKVISVDDHIVEPPDLWQRWLPAKYRDVGPRVVEVLADGSEQPVRVDDDGVVIETERNAFHFWLSEGTRLPVALQGSPRTRRFRTDGTDEDFHARSYNDMIPACYELKARLEAMDEDGVHAATLFPTYLRFAATGLLQTVTDKDGLGNAIVQAYNDYMIDEWCAGAPGRFIPMMVLPLWDPQGAATEIRRCAAKGFKTITFPENPAGLKLPSYWTDHWDPVFGAAAETGLVLSMHIGTSGSLVIPAPESTMNVPIALCGLNAMSACIDLIFSGLLNRHPDVKIALSEGGSGWAPYLIERADYTWERTRIAADRSLPPSELFKQHFWTCFISDQTAINTRHEFPGGVSKLMWEGDFPHNDSQYPSSRVLLEKALADVPDDEAKMIAETNARNLFNFWD